MTGENLAAWLEMQGLPVHRAAGAVWWEPEPGVLEPVAPVTAGQQIAFEQERENITLLLKLTSKHAARYAGPEGDGLPLPWCVWHRRESYSRPTGEVVLLEGWQLRATPVARFADLIARHAAWQAVARYSDSGVLDSYLISCEDSGWIHEVECSHPDDSRGEELRRYWQHRIRHSEEWLGLIHRPSRYSGTNTNLRWSTVQGRGARFWRAWRSLRALAS
jgi:hypothetical protein